MIEAELDREDHSSIPRNCNREGPEPLDTRTNQIKPVVKPKKKYYV
jgi:hypothetical protein